MNDSHQSPIALEKAVAEYIAGSLRANHPGVSPLLRVRIAHATAKIIVHRAEEAGTLRDLQYRLSIAEAGEFEI